MFTLATLPFIATPDHWHFGWAPAKFTVSTEVDVHENQIFDVCVYTSCSTWQRVAGWLLGPDETEWRVLEQRFEKGECRNLGVWNMEVKEIEKIQAIARHPPRVWMGMVDIEHQRRDIQELCARKNMTSVAVVAAALEGTKPPILKMLGGKHRSKTSMEMEIKYLSQRFAHVLAPEREFSMDFNLTLRDDGYLEDLDTKIPLATTCGRSEL
eukprot:GEMP01050092.1.p1 GENE.GEMP01050092.1~~GEMP01050092.1.p1  ORF type:complete len:211 (+),score=44.23 GEMP01050092.1:63-695(+)